MTSVRFLGGTSTVTGSKFLIETGSGSALVDCGMFQGNRKVRERNWKDPMAGSAIPDEVLVTHAHIDHTGLIPRLVGTYGFNGHIRATAATVDLLGVMLADSARLQQEQAKYANKKGYSRHKPALPLYTEKDVAKAMSLMRGERYHEWLDSSVGRIRFTFAGHILGSSHIAVETDDSRIVFSGDIGRWDIPVLKDPEPPPEADLVVIESTYGNRLHGDDGDPNEWLASAINKLAERRGVMVIPAFSVGRTQEVLYRIREMEDSGAIARLPVFLDSPMATDATELYRAHVEEHDLEMTALHGSGANPLRPDRLQVTRRVDQSKRLNSLEGPAIIISASGMATGGRVVHHLKRRLPHRNNMVVFVGYQAAGTRGRSLVEGAKKVKIHNQVIPVRAEVVKFGGFSAHADRRELLRWLGSGPGRPGQVALVHGEADARSALATAIKEELGFPVVVPRQGGVIRL